MDTTILSGRGYGSHKTRHRTGCIRVLATLLGSLLIGSSSGCDYLTSRDQINRAREVCSASQRNGLLDSAVDSCTRALEIARRYDYPEALLSDLTYELAGLERARGNFQRAESLIRESLTLQQASGSPEGMTQRLVELALDLACQDRWEEGLAVLDQAASTVDGLAGGERDKAANAFRGYRLRLGPSLSSERLEQIRKIEEALARP